MARATIKLKRPITDFELDIDENSIEAVGYVKVVRCKDCKYWFVPSLSNGESLCERHTVYGNEPHPVWTTGEWYCADGKRRER